MQDGSHFYVPCRSICDWDQNWTKQPKLFLESQSSDQCNFQTDQDMWLQFDFDPLKPSNQELQKETINQSICQLKSWSQSQALQQVTHKWLPLVIVMFYKVGVAMYDFGENVYTL